MNLVFLAGSFHEKSFTQALIRVMADILKIESAPVLPIHHLPFYSEDLTGDRQPAHVTEFRKAIEHSDGIIVCTPEYNHSIPAVLKNAVDWASRPAFRSPLKGKPVTFITQAKSHVGGARAQAHLKGIFDSTLSHLHSGHEMMVAEVDKCFDADLNLTDDAVRVRLQNHLKDFCANVAQQKQ